MQMFRAVDRARALNMGRKAQHLTRQFSLLRPGALLPEIHKAPLSANMLDFKSLSIMLVPQYSAEITKLKAIRISPARRSRSSYRSGKYL